MPLDIPRVRRICSRCACPNGHHCELVVASEPVVKARWFLASGQSCFKTTWAALPASHMHGTLLVASAELHPGSARACSCLVNRSFPHPQSCCLLLLLSCSSSAPLAPALVMQRCRTWCSMFRTRLQLAGSRRSAAVPIAAGVAQTAAPAGVDCKVVTCKLVQEGLVNFSLKQGFLPGVRTSCFFCYEPCTTWRLLTTIVQCVFRRSACATHATAAAAQRGQLQLATSWSCCREQATL